LKDRENLDTKKILDKKSNFIDENIDKVYFKKSRNQLNQINFLSDENRDNKVKTIMNNIK